MITIILVEDNNTLRFILKDLLQREPDFSLVAIVEDGATALDVVQRLRPMVVILDIRLPDMNGLDAIPLLKACSPETQVIVHSLHNETPYIHKALKNGASDFVLKSDRTSELYKAIRTANLKRIAANDIHKV